MTWFIQRPERFLAEKDALATLEQQEAWISNVSWRITETLALAVDADLHVGDIVRPVTLTYPLIFPGAPPLVKPRGVTERWSGHQYGAQGELCLEHRADNWESSVTGADMLRSAYKLLSTEQPDAGQPAGEVVSAHRLTLGQELRSGPFRVLLTNSLQMWVSTAIEPLSLRVRPEYLARTRVGFVVTGTNSDGTVWRDPELPDGITKWDYEDGFALDLQDGDPRISDCQAAVKAGATDLHKLLVGERPFASSETLLIQVGGLIHAYWLDPSDNSVTECHLVTSDHFERRPERTESLTHKKFAIIGCGSLGSKVAVMLARSGVRHLLLVDDDVLCPENMMRNELDWFAVGFHKADALADRIRCIAAGVQIEVRRHRLGGQEASGSLDSLMKSLSECDVIVEATANPEAFNYAAAVAEQFSRTMVWAQVFAGGYGGLIARSRPGLDPAPLQARAKIENWCSNPDYPPAPKPTVNYGAHNVSGEAEPMIADDADASVIAAHCSRMILDAAATPPISDFESSAYMIGLRKEWIFRAAFDTWPIDLGTSANSVATTVSPEVSAKAIETLLALLQSDKA